MKLIQCQNCHKNPVEVSFTHIENGHREDYVLCHSCANNLHMQERFGNFLNQLLEVHQQEQKPAIKAEQLEQTATISEANTIKSKMLALQMDKEAAIANENYLEAARIQKILNQLAAESKN